MLVRSDRFELLASPAFIAALALLVLNDFALKPLFHNALVCHGTRTARASRSIKRRR